MGKKEQYISPIPQIKVLLTLQMLKNNLFSLIKQYKQQCSKSHIWLLTNKPT
jgi:hypothetical protein